MTMVITSVYTKSMKKVIMSNGMGVESAAILLRWIHEPESRNFALSDLMVVTAMTGDEFSDTGKLMETYLLPLFRKHGIRFVQVARAGHFQEAGIKLLDDSTAPSTLYLKGAYKLSDELREAATIPTTGGVRKCSLKFKGWVIDTFLKRELQGAPFRHIMGFNVNEPKRVRKDQLGGEMSDVENRHAEYPLVEWKWDRATCLAYIKSVTGADWKKSCCQYCPFAAPKKSEGWHLKDRYTEMPEAAAMALELEHQALAFNPEMKLYASRTLAETLEKHGITAPARILAKRLETAEFALYRVRRVFSGPAQARRAIEKVATGSQAAMHGKLVAYAAKNGLELSREAGIERVYVTRRIPDLYPAFEEMFVVAPAVTETKINKGFEKALSARTA